MIELQAKANAAQIGKAIDRAEKGLEKAQLDAIKVEGFSLMHTMRQAILMGTPAPGMRLRDLSMIARTVNRRAGVRQPIPLKQLAAGITYNVDPVSASMRVGFTQRSSVWARRAAEMQQRGFTRPITPQMRLFMLRRGAQRSFSRSWRGRRTGNPLFLKLTTRQFVTPARPIVDPFWASESQKSEARIRRNFRLIMRGATAPGGNLYSASDMAMW